MPKASIVICSLNRKESLAKLFDSLKAQTSQDYELIVCYEEGNLVELKDKGWRKAKGEIIIWLDDDVMCEEHWLENIIQIFDTRKDVVGVTGPTYVPSAYLKNRDVFRQGLFKDFYKWFFLEGRALEPGRITKCGVNTIGANYPTMFVQKAQLVDFLEPPQFAIRRWVVESVDGFDLSYSGVGEWCDVDLCYRISEFGKLLFHPQVQVKHFPVKDSTTSKRLDTKSRYDNYCKFANKWVQRSFKNDLYRLFLRIYFKLLSMQLVG